MGLEIMINMNQTVGTVTLVRLASDGGSAAASK